MKSICRICERSIGSDDTIIADNYLEHRNCPVCFQCGTFLGVERYPVPGVPGYGSWGVAFYCAKCLLEKIK